MNKTFIISLVLATIIITASLIFTYNVFYPRPMTVAERYIDLWSDKDFSDLNSLLRNSKKYNRGDIISTYKDFNKKTNPSIKIRENPQILEESFNKVKLQYSASLEYPNFENENITYFITLKRENLFNWKVDWKPSLVHPELEFPASFTENRIKPERGKILSRNDKILAHKGKAVVVGVRPDKIDDEKKLHNTTEELLNLDTEWVKDQYEDANPDWFVPLKTISEKQYKKMEKQLRPIPGVYFRQKEAREYPYGELTGHITGYIGRISEDKLSQSKHDYRTDDRIGKSGLEKYFEDELRGEPGYKLEAHSLINEEKQIIMEKDSTAGEDIKTTIDIELQKIAKDALADKPGAISIFSAESGEVLALVNNPSFDPNLFSLGITNTDWQRLQNNDKQPLLDRVLKGKYPPGSIFKAYTASAALEKDIIETDTAFEDSGELNINGNIIKNFRDKVHGEHTLRDGLTHSINTTMAKVGIMLGRENLIEFCEQPNLFQTDKFELPVSDNSLGKINNNIELGWTSIGQSKVTVSPFNITKFMTAIASGGKIIEPHILQRNDVIEKNRIMSEENAMKITNIMQDVVKEGTGDKADIPSLSIAGKTGTAEIEKDDNKESHAWFTGFSKNSRPQMAFTVFLEEGGVGGEEAAPVIRNIFLEYFELYPDYDIK